MKSLKSKKWILSIYVLLSLNTIGQVTTNLISVKTADVANFTNTHKQWRFEIIAFRMYNTVAGKYLTAKTDGSVTLEAKDESSTASFQYWALFHSPYGGVSFRSVGAAVSPSDYLRTLSFVTTESDDGTGASALSMNLLTTYGSGYSELNINNSPNLTPTPGTSYTINTINWYTRSIVANVGYTGIQAIDNNNNTEYNQWQFEVVNVEPTYPEMTYYKRIYNTKANKYLTAQNNAGVYNPVLNIKDQSATASLQYWTIVTGLYDAILFRNFGAGGINDLNQGLSGADLVASGTHEVNLTTLDGPGGALLQLDDNTVKIPVPGTDYSIQSISWYGRSLLSSIVENTGGDLSSAGLTDTQLANTNLSVKIGDLVINATKTVKSVTVSPGAKLSIGTGNTLTTTSGITLQSDATGTATLLNSGTYTGTLIAQQYLGTARNWYVSSPVSNATSPSTNITRYYEYVEAGNNDYPKDGSNNPINVGETSYWKYWTTANPMTVGKGYIAQASAETTVSFTGTPNNGNITTSFNLTRDDAKGKGFNLVGNPYPSYIDWSLVAGANTNLMSTAWFKTKKTDVAGGAYTFASVNVATPSSPEIVSNSANTTITKYIPPMQAFWVRVKSGTASTSMSFTNAMREHRLNNGDIMKAPKLSERMRLRLQLINGTETDETLLYFDANATNDYNDFDSPKMLNNSTTTPDLYSKAGSERLVINGLNAITNNMELPLGFSLNAAATLKLKATQLSNFPVGTKVYLLDKESPTPTELLPETEYTFSTTAPTANNESRFSLLFKVSGASTGVNNVDKESVSVFVNAQNQLVINANAGSKYAVYNTVGQQVANGTTTSNIQTSNFKLINGVYVVKVNNQSTRVIIK